MKTLIGLMATVCLLCSCASAQSTEAEISARLMGKPLQLRGFWMDDKLKFDASGKTIGTATEGSFTESAIDVKKVTLKDGHLRIEGQRVGLLFTGEKAGILFVGDGTVKRLPIFKKSLFHKEPVMIDIDIDGHGNPDFGTELDAVFAASLAEIAPSLRPYWQRYARKHFLHEEVPAESTDSAVSKIGAAVKPPKVLKSVDPNFSDSARALGISGETLIDLVVDEQGLPTHISVARPLGLGLDERAIAAILQYRFAPAMRDGVPLKVAISIDVNFQIF